MRKLLYSIVCEMKEVTNNAQLTQPAADSGEQPQEEKVQEALMDSEPVVRRVEMGPVVYPLWEEVGMALMDSELEVHQVVMGDLELEAMVECSLEVGLLRSTKF